MLVIQELRERKMQLEAERDALIRKVRRSFEYPLKALQKQHQAYLALLPTLTLHGQFKVIRPILAEQKQHLQQLNSYSRQCIPIAKEIFTLNEEIAAIEQEIEKIGLG